MISLPCKRNVIINLVRAHCGGYFIAKLAESSLTVITAVMLYLFDTDVIKCWLHDAYNMKHATSLLVILIPQILLP